MDGVSNGDPFYWDVETVASVLAAPNSPWTRDPSFLAAQILDQEIDGETLLKYERICSRQELEDCLGIRLARHKVTFGEAIFTLKSKSWGYQKWRLEFDKKQNDTSFGDRLNESLSRGSIPSDSQPALPPHENGSEINGSSHQKISINSTSRETGVNDLAPQYLPGAAASTLNNATVDETGSHPLDENDHHDSFEHVNPLQGSESSQPTLQSPEPERPTKRKRIAPTNLTDRPINVAPAFIPTEADRITFDVTLNRVEDQGLPWEKASSNAYLGDGSLTLETIKAPSGSLTSRLHETSDDSFTVTVPNWLPTGRRLAVHRAMKRLLMKNSRHEMLEKRGFASIRSPSPGDSDSILDLDDLPDSFDDETLREMEEERLEREQREANANRLTLSSEQVRNILDAAIEEMTRNWEEKKLPKLQRKAFSLWHNAQRKGFKESVLRAHMQAKSVDNRIKKLCSEIIEEIWKSPSEVKNQANCLEQSVHDKLHHKWLAEMLGSRVSPPKPDLALQPKKQMIRKTEDLMDEEILTSSDEDDFLVPDDHTNLNQDSMELDIVAETDQPIPIKIEIPKVIHRAQSPWGPASPGGTIHIDLTSPVKPPPSPTITVQSGDNIVESTSQPSNRMNHPTLEELGNFEEIGRETPKYWARIGDQWKLLICLIWRLPHSRRVAMINFLQDNSVDDAWDKSVMCHLSDPIPGIEDLGKEITKTTVFDVTRIFLSFVRVKDYQEHLPILLPLSGHLKTKVLSSKNSWFHVFQSFIKHTAAEFPQASQIYNLDVSDDDALEDNANDEIPTSEEEGVTLLRQKRPNREIIQNREAVDLRERENARVREQRARRDKLREKLSQLDSMPRDRARLIVNESKQDDQSFIYVNEDIGKRIKDHQLEGVRFMWNQIVLDPRIRQGCLLAHTMGLGKTMQAITLLVVIREAAISLDPSVRAQIPKDLRESKTVVVCPPGLVDNWVDEFLMWAPDGVLGEFRRIDASMTNIERPETIRKWARDGGVLVIGYFMLGEMASAYPDSADLLFKRANVVIADEAHLMKNPKTQANECCSRFVTKSRIALTGSPLANNVLEYHSMIDWVAPNFLGPITEFREIYAKPIEHGLWKDSTGPQKRNALKKLEALKVMVAPKVNRATIKTCLKEDLPPKWEFVLMVPSTPTQFRLYDLYRDAVINHTDNMTQTRTFAVTDNLRLICNHPRCFQEKINQITNPNPKITGEAAPSFPKAIIPQALKELKSPDPNLTSLSWKVELLTIILDEAKTIGDKVLVFTQSLLAIEYLVNLFRMQKRSFSCLTGKTPIDKRQELTKTFNNGEQEIFLISTTAGGVGLNIYGANRVVIFDFKWNPVQEQQAIGRAYRIGQKKTVFVYTFVVAGSFEEDLQNRHVFKTQLASRVVDKRNPLSWSHRHSELLHPLRETRAKSLSEFEGKDHILDKLIRYKMNGQSIRSIISTDTFEEEDPDVALTEVERRDVDSMVELNRLRVADPIAFSRAQEKSKQDEFYRLARQSQSALQHISQLQANRLTLNPSNPPPATLQPLGDVPGATERTSDGRGLVARRSGVASQPAPQTRGLASPASHSSQPIQASSQISGPAPLPVTGANTYFGTLPLVSQSTAIGPADIPAAATTHAPRATPPTPKPTSTSVPTLTPTPTATTAAQRGLFSGNLFSQPLNQNKHDFRSHLEDRIKDLRRRGFLNPTYDPAKVGRTLTDKIDVARKNKGLGFLPDNQRWKELESLLTHDQFVIALVSGHFTPQWVALADRKDIEGRVEAPDQVQGEMTSAQGSRDSSCPDPHNLQNIERLTAYGGTMSQGRHAREDMEAMREAAENRRRRGMHLGPYPATDERRARPPN
ncbi:hypothetical protein BGZ63DRAFT_109542 [Mariannaea sp. PMI_226]|nr:hypothetical protein BGZ63DRAFT_109542 [Mariannaea sp. PMI_226]